MENTDFERMMYAVQETVKSKPEELKMAKAFDNDESASEVKTLNTVQRLAIAQGIISKYSMLKKQKGILHEQVFSAMEEYLDECGIAGVMDLKHTRLLKEIKNL